MSNKIITHCLKCGKSIVTTSYRVAQGRGKFCSRACSTSYNHTGRPKPKSRENIKAAIRTHIGRPAHNRKPYVKITCGICGAVFGVPQRRADEARYCSRECSHEAKRRVRGTKHPLWKRVRMACEVCGKLRWVKPAKVHEFRFCSRRCQGIQVAAQIAEHTGPTSIEQLLMDELDRREIGYRSQHLIANWLIDITLSQHRIAIEADGDYWHSLPERKEKDARKDRWLRAHKWAIFRFSGSEIRRSPKACIDKVVQHVHKHGKKGRKGQLTLF